MEKYIRIDAASTIVVISGAAITAGSNLQRFASIGSVQPINCDTITIPATDRLTTVEIGRAHV